MTTDAVPNDCEAILAATLADTPTFDFRSMRSFQIRADATVVVTVYNARRDETSRFKNVSIGGSDMTLSLTDKWLVLTQDQALALFSCHFVRLVAASGTPTIEFTAKA